MATPEAEEQNSDDDIPVVPLATEARKDIRLVKETKAIVIDIGTRHCKTGYAGDHKPAYIVSSTVGKHFQETAKTGDNRKESFVGQELLNAKINLKLVNPLRHGIVVDWECVQDIWEYIFVKEMKISPEEHAALISDPPLSPVTNREKYAETLFEVFGSPAMHIANQSILSMYSYGKISGLVVESGHAVSYVVPIYEGYMLPNITERVDYAGSDVTKFLKQLLNDAGNMFTEDHLPMMDYMKKKCCYLSLDLGYEMGLPSSDYVVDYELPDGRIITIGKERFLCSEALFNPSLIGLNQPGLQTLVNGSINKCDDTLRHDMLSNILLCGGSTTLEGFPDRFQRELNKAFPKDDIPIIEASPERKYAVWTGGSILASLKSFQQLWVSKEEYEEQGPMVIYRKCF
ncbi:actin-like protein 7B [Ambystoma mexicanum]|uniref:actin-like protein 7B n=1 Tax=Ambystoma mexicanum TaxID=8296 RepID=UPI0037E8B8A0